VGDSLGIPFTKETLVTALAAELDRVQQLGPVIDQTIEETKRQHET
jgi:hypothetical protein